MRAFRGPTAPGDGDIISVLIVPDIQRYHAVFGMVKLETLCGVCPRVLGRLLGFGTAGGSLLRAANPDDIMNRYVHYYRTCLHEPIEYRMGIITS